MTRAWAVEEGLSALEAQVVAEACWDVDRIHNVHLWKNKGYHFAALGARRKARRLLAVAVANGDLVALGEALHCTQDAIGHGFWGHVVHWKGIDRWAHRGPRVRARLERESREMIARYVASRAIS